MPNWVLARRGLLTCGLVLLGMAGGAGIVSAQVPSPPPATPALPGQDLFTPENIVARGNVTLEGILGSTLNTLLFVAGFIAVIAVIWSGILYLTSAGDETKATKAKSALLYSVIGILIIALAFGISHFLASDAADAISGGRSLGN